MKIAVLISGEYRAFDLCRPTMEFLDRPEVDVYFSTWDRTKFFVPMFDQVINEEITADRILSDLGRNAVIQIDPVTTLSSLSRKCGVYMMYRWIQGFDLIKHSGIHYDYVIITRPDLYIEWSDQLKDIQQFENSFCVPWTDVDSGFLNDVFLISSYANMLKLFENTNIDDYVNDYETDWHTWWFKHVKKTVGNIFEYHGMLMSICRPFVKQGMAYSDIHKIEMDWNELKILEIDRDCPEENWHSEEYISKLKIKWAEGYYEKYKGPVEVGPFIKEFKGFSDSRIFLMQDADGKLFVRKKGNINRNYEKLLLMDNFKVPKVYNKTEDTIDMEYIEGIDIAQYLLYYNNLPLIKFIIDTLQKFKKTIQLKDYTAAYSKHLDKINYQDLPFTKDELFNKLPAVLPQSLCHGDFTLENIIYTKTNEFCLIDCSTGDYDSWIFDIAKLRQDLDAQWFIRHQNLKLDSSLLTIKNKLRETFPEAFNDNIYILMLLRVYVYCRPGSLEHKILLTEIKRLWK